VLVRITHLLRYQLDGTAAADAVVEAVDAGTGPLFAPGQLPCGECPACRRALVAICAARRVLVDAAGPVPAVPVEVPDRFLTPLDDPPGLAALAPPVALLAGPVALAQQALALASAGPGDAAVWLGGDPLARLGARTTAARGLKTFLLATPGDQALPAEGVTTGSDPDALGEAIAAAETPAGGHAARTQRHLIATRSTPALWAVAARLAAPGGTLTLLGPGPLRLPAIELPPELRLLRTGAYHPDLVPEALALLRREPEEFKYHLNSEGPVEFGLS
jgi:threonine dehydrogenase-like Zn-dependent dehydrogenase